MSFAWQQMSVAELACYEGLLAGGIISVNGVYWSRVRPLFYRPLLLFQEQWPESVRPPAIARAGGFQYAVPGSVKANSLLNLLMFQEAGTYRLDKLDSNRKREVNLAAKHFVIRAVTNRDEFRRSAHPVYLSFYNRTRYSYGAQRRNPVAFSRWTDALYDLPSITILGGYRKGGLEGVSLSFLVGDTLCYAMFFCDDESLRLGLSALMLHTVRESVAASGCAGRIFAGMHRGGNGLDKFYLLKGCSLVRMPARLELNPLAEKFLRRFLPGQYARLKGGFGEDHRPAKGMVPQAAAA